MNQPKSLQAGTRIDDYEITGTLWTTNSGFIYRARELDRDRDVLVQEYLPASLATRHWSGIHAMALEGLEDEFDQGLTRFLWEARILAQINDPYVCRVYEYTEANATAYMVLDYEPGQTLAEHLAGSRKPLDEAEIRQLLVPLLKGLRVAHAADLLHRDIHPANIYLRDVGPPVLIGFGSPAVPVRDDSEHHVEQRIAPGYSPVEQYQSDGDVGPWSDLYALGATMYRCLSGATPVEATRRITHIAQDKEDPLVPALELGGGDYSAALLSAIDWMLEPMASDRPESAGAVLGSLSEDSSSTVQQTPEQSSHSKTQSQEKSRKKQNRSGRKAQHELETPYRDHSRRRAPTLGPSTTAGAGDAVTETTARGAAASPRRPTRGGKTLNTAWGWPLLMVAAGLAVIGFFVLYDPGPSKNLAVSNAMPETGVPAPAPDHDYPPPDIPETVKFDREQDEERAAEYRDLERRIEKIEQMLASAEKNLGEGRLVSPPGNNALADYRAVLDLDPDHVDARLGLDAVQDELVESAAAAFEAGDIDEANRLLDHAGGITADDEQVAALKERIAQHTARKEQDEVMESARAAFEAGDINEANRLLDRAEAISTGNEQVAALREKIAQHVAEKEREAERAREAERRRLEAEAQAAQQRRERIASLVARAESAFEDDRLTQPPGDNALGYYRQVLRLAPDHPEAEAGVDRVGQRFLDRAAEALALDELDKADGLLNTAAAILPDNESIPLLRKQLETRRAVAERERRRREQEAEREAERQAQAEQEDVVRNAAGEAGNQAMTEGITAYYGGNYEFAFRRLNPLAEQGNPRAKFRVAMMYYHGRGVEQDTNLARTLIQEALPQIRKNAEQGVAWAQADLGSLYADGIVLTEDDSEAVRLYTLAAEQGYAGAQTNLGVMYANGEGVDQSRENAVLWLRRAAAQGDRIAQNNLKALGVE